MISGLDVRFGNDVYNAAGRFIYYTFPVLRIIGKLYHAVTFHGKVFTHHLVAARSTEHLVADLDVGNAGADRLNDADAFMADYVRHRSGGIHASVEPRVPAAKSAGHCFYTHLVVPGLSDFVR